MSKVTVLIPAAGAGKRMGKAPAKQFLMLGDNSAASKDSRLWEQDSEYPGGPPLEYYVRRDLLLGKALFIYWPHSWDKRVCRDRGWGHAPLAAVWPDSSGTG